MLISLLAVIVTQTSIQSVELPSFNARVSLTLPESSGLVVEPGGYQFRFTSQTGPIRFVLSPYMKDVADDIRRSQTGPLPRGAVVFKGASGVPWYGIYRDGRKKEVSFLNFSAVWGKKWILQGGFTFRDKPLAKGEFERLTEIVRSIRLETIK